MVDNKLTSESLRLDDLHVQEPQIFYFGKILQKYYGSKVQLDEYLEQNFNLWINGAANGFSPEGIRKLFKLDRQLKENHNLTITTWRGQI